MSHEAGPGPSHFLDCQFDPEVVAGIAVIQGGDSPGHLRPLRVVDRVVVSAIISQLLHSKGRWPRFGHAFIGRTSLPVTLDNAFGPDLDVVGVLAGITPGATLA